MLTDSTEPARASTSMMMKPDELYFGAKKTAQRPESQIGGAGPVRKG